MNKSRFSESYYLARPITVLFSVCKVGDGTTSVVLLAGEILRNCKSFVEDNVHPQVIVRGLRKATQLALQRIRDIAVKVEIEDPE